jgi:hypothetical protein
VARQWGAQEPTSSAADAARDGTSASGSEQRTWRREAAASDVAGSAAAGCRRKGEARRPRSPSCRAERISVVMAECNAVVVHLCLRARAMRQPGAQRGA